MEGGGGGLKPQKFQILPILKVHLKIIVKLQKASKQISIISFEKLINATAQQ